MKSILKARARRVTKEVQMASLMRELGYDVEEDPREQQFRCDLHGGRDSKPSARLYPATNSTYCFACAKSRSPLTLLMDKREMGFAPAVEWLERWAGLPPLQDIPEGEEEEEHPTEDPPELTYGVSSVKSLLAQVTRDREIPLDLALKFWSAFDLILEMKRGPEWSLSQLQILKDRILQALRERGR